MSKIKQGFKLISVAGEHMVVPLGIQIVDFQAMITLNDTGAFLWQALQEGCSEDELTEKLIERYEVKEEKARMDVKRFLGILEQEGLLE